MLKQERVLIQALIAQAAAFGRLCVETHGNCGVDVDISALQPPSGGCVLKRIYKDGALYDIRAAAFGRLCVETGKSKAPPSVAVGSRLRAAVC